MPIDESLKFLPVNIAVLTVSDTRDMASDRSGQTLQDRIEAARHHCVAREIVKDDPDTIEAVLRRWIADPAVDCVITTGGTGISGRDVTPEAFKRVLEKEIEGFGELFRWISFQKIGTSTIQSRAMGGTHFDSIEALHAAVLQQLPRASSVLVKGSRFMKMERVTEAMQAACANESASVNACTTASAQTEVQAEVQVQVHAEGMIILIKRA